MRGWAGNIRYSIPNHVIHCGQGYKNIFNQACHYPLNVDLRKFGKLGL